MAAAEPDESLPDGIELHDEARARRIFTLSQMYPGALPSQLLAENAADMDDQIALAHRYGVAYYLMHKPAA